MQMAAADFIVVDHHSHQGLLFLAAIFATGFTSVFAAFSAGLAFV